MVRSFEPQSGPEELARNPHRFTVSGTSNTQWRLIPEQSEVTLACDFSDLLEDPSRTVFAIRDDRFAEAFAAKNGARIVPEKVKARHGH